VIGVIAATRWSSWLFIDRGEGEQNFPDEE
jgi:hypothetical protein